MGGIDERTHFDVLVDDQRDVLENGREREHVLVDDSLGNRFEERPEIELECTPLTAEQRRMELAQPARLSRCRLAGVKQSV